MGLVLDFSATTLVPSRVTRQKPILARMVCDLARRLFPEFPFTSTMINLGGSRLHIDKNNRGPSMILSLGEHTGGELWQYPGDILDIHMKPTKCDGLLPHVTLPFQGERYSLVYYCINPSRAAPTPSDAEFLKELGFWSLADAPSEAGRPRADLLSEAAKLVGPLL